MNFLILTVVLFLCSVGSSVSLPVSEGDASEGLLLLHVVHRHGARARDESTYPNDPYINETFYPYGLGQLTSVGKQIEYKIGTDLRERYNTFLGDLYFPESVDARSTDVNRTKMSIALSLAGLYPPVGELVWNNYLNWQPIPYNYEKSTVDYLLGFASSYCPKYSTLFQEYLTGDGEAVFEDDSELYSYLSEYSGWDVTSPTYPYVLYFSLKTEEEWGLELPAWTESVWEEPLRQAAIKFYTVATGTNELKKLASGFFLKKVLQDSIAKVDGTLFPQDRKLFLYSGHEYNVGFILNSLNVFEPTIPNYGSHIIIEVREVDGVYGIQVLFQNYEGSAGLQLLTIPGCDSFCPLDQFAELIKDIIPESEEDCNE